MKIKLINPTHLDDDGKPVKSAMKIFTGLTLPYLAALIGPEHDVSIIDDEVEDVEFSDAVDLVGITALSCQIPRGYQIADEYRRRQVPVVIGGFHVSMMPEEALQHCDAVVKGEAEGLIETILDDTAAGKLGGVYERKTPPDLKGLPVPRYDLIHFDYYLSPYYPVQATRGCPNNCDFCTVTLFYNKRYGRRPVDEVIAEMRHTGPHVFIVDNNLTADREYALALFRKMIPLQKRWCGQFDAAATADDELMQAASDSGCIWVYIGIETPDREKLASVNKSPNLKVPPDVAIRQLRRYHIEPFASMMIGFDSDTPATVDEIVDFCNKTKIGAFFLYILTPPPGSVLYQRLMEQGVTLKEGWHLYDGTRSIYDTPEMTSQELEQMHTDIYRRVYSVNSIIRRTWFPPHFLMAFANWFVFRRSLKKRRHPWLGSYRSYQKYLIKAVTGVATVLTHPRARKASQLIRLEKRSEK